MASDPSSNNHPAISAAVFDFDGTIADTLTEALEIVNKLAPSYGFEPVSREFAETLRSFGAREVISRVGVKPRALPKLHLEIRRLLKDRIPSVNPFQGIPEAITKLAKGRIRLGVLTSNSADNVRCFLDRTGLLPNFQFVIGASSLFGKARHLRKILNNELAGIPVSEIAYIGDEVRDIQAAHKAGLRSVAVSWGLNTREALAKTKPQHIFDSPHELSAAFVD